MKKLLLCGLSVLLMVYVVPVSAFEWNWGVDGWEGWSHTGTWSGTEIGPNFEYGPFIVNGHGEHGTFTNLLAGTTNSIVERTFIDPAGTGWNSLTFKGHLTASDVPSGRWMTIDVNGQEVFSANALSVPPGNGQDFEIQCTFPQSSIVTIKISHGQDPAWGPFFLMRYYSLVLSSPGSLEVKSSPSHAKIYINGVDTGKYAKWTFEVMAPGEYEVYVTLDEYITPETEHVTVVSEHTSSLHFNLKKKVVPVPEFPSIFLPSTMIIGLFGAVLLIQRTREQ